LDISDFSTIGNLRCTIKKKDILLGNKVKFEYLKRILPILSFLLLSAFVSSAQDSRGVIPQRDKKISLYPNPASSYITFDLQKNYEKGLTIVVFNFLGKKITERQSVNEKTQLSLTDYARGTYIYHLVDQSGKVIDTGKFQVAK